MNTLTVNYGDAAITVRRATVLDNLNRTRCAVKCSEWVKDDTILDTVVWQWVNIITRTVTVEGVDYTLPTIAHTEDELKAAFDAFLALDGDLVEKWTDAITQINAPLNDKKFAPIVGEPDPK